MKKYILYLFSIALMAVSCSQEHLRPLATSNRDDNREIHFVQEALNKEFEQGTKEGEIAVTVARNGNKGTYRVQLQLSGQNASLFSVDEIVVIPDGEYSVDVPVRVKMSEVVLGATVSASLTIIGRDAELGEDSAYIDQYSDFLTMKASFILEWEPLMRTTESGEEVQQTATFFYDGFYSGAQTGMLVERAKGTTNIFRLLDWAAGVPFFFKVNSNKSVVVPGQSIGYFDENAGEYVQVSDVAQYIGDDAAYSQYPCTFDGKQTYDLTLIYYGTGGYYTIANERVVFASDRDSDPVIEAEYKGDGNFVFEFNRYAVNCRAIVVEGDVTGDKTALDAKYKEICLGTAEGMKTITPDMESVSWTPESPSNTMLAVPFDSEGKPGEMVAIRFTYDTDGTVLPQVVECELLADALDPYTSAKVVFKTKNASSARILLLEKDALESYFENYSNDVIFSALGRELSTEEVQRANSGDGFVLNLNRTLTEGETYMFAVEAFNKYGDSLLAKAELKLKSHADVFQNKTIDDFTGSFMVSADVITSEASASEAFRVDIYKTGENTVSIKGLCNDSKYSPAITGIFIPEENCIRVSSQNLGEYSYMQVVFGFVAPMYSGIWGQSSSLEFGYGSDGNLYWRSTAGSEFAVNGYSFLLFDGPQFSGYSVSEKSYTNIMMVRL